MTEQDIYILGIFVKKLLFLEIFRNQYIPDLF